MPVSPTPALDRRLLRELCQIRDKSLDLDDLGRLAYAKAKLLYRSGKLGDALNHITKTIDKLGREGHSDSLMGRLYLALGILRTTSGAYEASLEAFAEAWSIATKLDDLMLQHLTAGNTSISNHRLGHFQEQIAWATRALEAADKVESSIGCVQNTAFLATGYALTGQRERALDVIRRFSPRVMTSDDHRHRQEWLVYSADVFQYCGDRKDALLMAEAAGVGSDEPFRLPRLLGTYARWTAIHGVLRNRVRVRAMLDRLVTNRHRFDRTDQIETLAASVWFDKRIGRRPSTIEEAALTRELKKAPRGILVTLERAGLTPLLEE